MDVSPFPGAHSSRGTVGSGPSRQRCQSSCAALAAHWPCPSALALVTCPTSNGQPDLTCASLGLDLRNFPRSQLFSDSRFNWPEWACGRQDGLAVLGLLSPFGQGQPCPPVAPARSRPTCLFLTGHLHRHLCGTPDRWPSAPLLLPWARPLPCTNSKLPRCPGFSNSDLPTMLVSLVCPCWWAHEL